VSIIKKIISIDEDLLEQSKAFSKNFSAIVNEALQLYLVQRRIKNAMKSFGQWENRSEDSVAIVNQLREEGTRNYAKRSN
jgi:post-segregation antitoxin (ccd killing protein)